MSRKESLAQVANRHVSFPHAVRLAGIGFYGEARERGSVIYCPFGFRHLDGGVDKAFRVYPDHGYCFAEKRWFSPVGLLAEVWDVSREDAAARVLDMVGYVPADYAHLWKEAVSDPEPDREALSVALTEWCRSQSSDWQTAQYDSRVTDLLSRCIGLLPLVKTESDCRRWLERCKAAMTVVLTSVK